MTLPDGSALPKSGQMTPDQVERALACIAIEHPEHREVLARAGTLLLRMSTMIALIHGAIKSGRGVDGLTP